MPLHIPGPSSKSLCRSGPIGLCHFYSFARFQEQHDGCSMQWVNSDDWLNNCEMINSLGWLIQGLGTTLSKGSKTNIYEWQVAFNENSLISARSSGEEKALVINKNYWDYWVVVENGAMREAKRSWEWCCKFWGLPRESTCWGAGAMWKESSNMERDRIETSSGLFSGLFACWQMAVMQQ